MYIPYFVKYRTEAKKISSYQGLIKPLKAARGHASIITPYVDNEILNVTKNSTSCYYVS